MAAGATSANGTAATEFIDATTAASFIRVMYSKKAIIGREQALFFANIVDRQYESEVQFGSSLKIPGVSYLSVTSKNTSANAATVYETITEEQSTITIGTWQYSAIALESFTETQADRDLLAVYAPRQGYALALAIDDALATLVGSVTNTVGTLGQELDYPDVLRSRQYLDDANAPNGDRRVVISPAQLSGFMKLEQFISNQLNTAATDVPMASSAEGTWMKMPVYTSTNVNGSNAAGHDNVMFHKEAIALCVQMNMRTHKFFDVDYFATKATAEQIHGSGLIRNDHAVWMKGA